MEKTTINSYIDQNKERVLNELLELLRIPSVSADSKYSADVLKTAEAVKNRLIEAGADKVEVSPTKGFPVVYGEKIIDPKKPTVIVYGHYDVQPADPLNLWDSPPFEPVIKKTALHPDGAIFARGSCDDKGQMYMHVKAFELMMKTNTLPCNVKFMIEGEEEVGSPSLGGWIIENKERLKGDVILISDTSIIANDIPSIDTGLRGLAYMEVEVTGPNRDLHSGVYGGGVANPINILCKIIASCHDENNHITIPGFYDKVKELSAEERRELNKAPFNVDAYKKDLGVDDVWGEKNFNTIERTGVR
ncbi:MAG: M20/M25/M40 family metallo-hydrolase, partial [Bacteroidia bacterium]